MSRSLKRICRVKHVHNVERLRPDWIGRLDTHQIDCLAGHLYHGLHRHLAKNGHIRYMTILRDPIERARSYINHLKHTKTEARYQDNLMVRRLSGNDRGRVGAIDVEMGLLTLSNAVVGDTAHLDALWEHLCRQFNTEAPIMEPQNVGGNDVKLSEAALVADHQYDIELYERAKWQVIS